MTFERLLHVDKIYGKRWEMVDGEMRWIVWSENSLIHPISWSLLIRGGEERFNHFIIPTILECDIWFGKLRRILSKVNEIRDCDGGWNFIIIILFLWSSHLLSLMIYHLISDLISCGRGHHLFSEFSNSEFSKGDDRTLSR